MSGWDVPSWPSSMPTAAVESEVCRYFLRNACSRGETCRYPHVLSAESPAPQGNEINNHWWPYGNGERMKLGDGKTQNCIYFSEGRCTRGNACNFRHDFIGKDSSALANVIPIPCNFYQRGTCTSGEACRFSHTAVLDDSRSSAKQIRQKIDLSPHISTSLDDPKISPNRYSPSTPCQFYVEGRCVRGHSCPFVHGIASTNDELSNICQLHVQGKCSRGAACPFIHGTINTKYSTPSYVVSMESCQFYNSGSGKCYRGDDCPFRHNRLGSKNSRQLCVFFQQGNCTRGDSCPFQHSAAKNDKWSSIPSPVLDRVFERGWNTGSRYAAEMPADPPVSRPPLQGPLQGLHSERGWDTCDRSTIDNDTNTLAVPPSPHGLDHDLPSEGERYGGGDVGAYETPHHDRLAPTDNNAANHLAGNQRRSNFNSAKPCRFFPQGNCRKGSACPFAHNSIDRFNEPQPERSRDVDDTETNHVADEEPVLSSDVPAEADNDKQKVCEFFEQGLCMDGTTCPFKHDTLAAWLDDDNVEVSNDNNNINEPAVCMNDTERIHLTSEFLVEPANGMINDGTVDPTPAPTDELGFNVSDDKTIDPTPECIIELVDDDEMVHPVHELTVEPAVGMVNADTVDPTHELTIEPAVCMIDNETVDPTPEFTVERSLFHSTVQFGDGAIVRQVTTAFESQHLFLSNLPPNVTENDVLGLVEPFGGIARVLIERCLPSPSNALVEFTECAEAVRALSHLDNTEYQFLTLRVREDLLDGSHILSKAASPQKNKVKISWPTPSLTGWAHYPSISRAKEEANALHGRIFDRRKIVATYVSPRKTQLHSFTVQIQGLPLGTTRTDMENFCPGVSSISLDSRENYDRNTTIQHVRILVARYEPSNSFDILPPEASQLKIIGFTQFSSAETVTNITKDVHHKKQDFLRGNRIGVEQIYWVRYSMPRSQFTTLKVNLDDVRDAHEQECKLRFYDMDENERAMDPVLVQIDGTNLKGIGRAKKTLETNLRGEALFLEDNDIWDEYFDSQEGAAFLANLNTNIKFFINFDTRTRTLRYYSREVPLEKVRDMIVRQLRIIRGRRHVIPISNDTIHSLVNGGLRSLCDDTNINVTMDVVKRELTVRGDSADVKKVKRYLTSLVSPEEVSGTNLPCSICVTPAVDPVTLPCGHIYCEKCLKHLLLSATVPNFSLLKCIANESGDNSEAGVSCNVDIPLNIICDILSPAEQTRLLKYSLLSHLRSHPDEFFYCPTPECQVVHRRGNAGIVLQCPSCRVTVCPMCDVKFHEGLTCAEYTDL